MRGMCPSIEVEIRLARADYMNDLIDVDEFVERIDRAYEDRTDYERRQHEQL